MRFDRSAYSLHSNLVDRFQARVVASGRQHVGRDVVWYTAATTHKRQGTDGRVVVDHRVAGNYRAVVNVDVSAEEYAVDKNDVIVDLAVVCNVRVGHQQVAVANPGGPVLFFGAAIDRDTLAEHVVVADEQSSV